MNQINTAKSKKINTSLFGPFIDLIKTNSGILIALVIMITTLSLSTQYFLTGDNLQDVFNYFTTNCVLAFCMTLTLITGEIDLSISSLVAFSGILICILLNAGIPFIPALLITLLTGGVIGLITGIVIAYSGMASFVVTLAMQGVIRGLAYIVSAGSRIASSNKEFFDLASGSVFDIPIQTIIVAFVAFLLFLLLSRSVLGRHMFAAGGNREAAIYSGIKVKRVISVTFAISGALACLAGVFAASRVTSGEPTMGIGYEGDAVAAAVLGGTAFTGGRGTIVGTILGALIIGILTNGLNLLEVSYYWQLVAKGLIIMLAVEIDTIKQRRSA